VHVDPASVAAGYAVPERVVSTEWLSANLGHRQLRLLEANEDSLLYDAGHIPTAAKVDWRSELASPNIHDVLDPSRFAALLNSKGVGRNHTVVVYGDKQNRWAAHLVWILTLFGHTDVRLLDGGRAAWLAEGRETTLDFPRLVQADYPLIKRDDETNRIFRDQLARSLGSSTVLDVRSPEEYAGPRRPVPEYPVERSARAGHIPSAKNIPWASAIHPSGHFLSAAELTQAFHGLAEGKRTKVVTYCQIGERSAHTWFVLKFLLGVSSTRNYDGGWSEWGNTIAAPFATGEEPGTP
jgi:thiosulfate/3-mercaptopyruvate sulfurtransferase